MLFDLRSKEAYNPVIISEIGLQEIICNNFNLFFPDITLVAKEFILNGWVRGGFKSGRIDILGFNQKSQSFVIFELKKGYTKNITNQIIDYVTYFQDNYDEIIEGEKIPKELSLKAQTKVPEIILIAGEFSHPSIKKMRSLEYSFKLFEYQIFENGIIDLKKISSNAKLQIKPGNIFPYTSKLKTKIDAYKIMLELVNSNKILGQFYKVSHPFLIINPTKLYEAYFNYCSELETWPVERVDFFEELKNHRDFVRGSLSFRSIGKKTSGYKFKIS